MRPGIHANGFQLVQVLRIHTELRVATALARAGEHIRQRHVAPSDINGPRGAVDKRCRIQAVPDAGHKVIIEDGKAEPCVAIKRAADRPGRAMVRQFQRRRDLAHQRAAQAEVAAPIQAGDAHGAGRIQ